MGQQTSVHTRAITAALEISASDNAKFISILVVSGTCTVQGDAKFKGSDSSAMTFSEGQSFTLGSENQGAPLDGITITPGGGGTTNVMVLL